MRCRDFSEHYPRWVDAPFHSLTTDELVEMLRYVRERFPEETKALLRRVVDEDPKMLAMLLDATK